MGRRAGVEGVEGGGGEGDWDKDWETGETGARTGWEEQGQNRFREDVGGEGGRKQSLAGLHLL